MFHFLNKLDFAGYLESDDYEKIKCNQKVSTDEFQDVNSEKLGNKLGFVDDLHILYKIQVFHDVQTLSSFVRGDIFFPVKEKTEVENFFPLSLLCY